MLVDPPRLYDGGAELNQVITVSPPSSLVSFNTILTALPPNLGKLAKRLAARAVQIGLFPVCDEARGTRRFEQLNLASYQAAELLNHASQHGLPISLTRGMSEEELHATLHCGAHSSAKREVGFDHQELSDQVQAGHIVVSPLDAV